MNIGLFTQALPYLPCTDGFRLYAANITRCLARRHRVDLVALVRPEDEGRITWARSHYASVTEIRVVRASRIAGLANAAAAFAAGRPFRYRAGVAEQLQRLARLRHWDVLHVEGNYIAGLIPPELPVPKILSIHDSAVFRCRALARTGSGWRHRLWYGLLAAYERRCERVVYPRFDACVVVAPRDAEYVCAAVRGIDVAIIPLGIDTDYFAPQSVEKRPNLVGFHGNLSYPPNVEAVLHFVHDVWPMVAHEIPEASFRVVGANPDARLRAVAEAAQCELLADLPDLRQALCAVQVYVSPVRNGTGMKNKILEAMALGVPAVCYPQSLDGMDCIAGRHILVARDPGDLASQIVGLLRNPSEAQRLAEAARRYAGRNSWEGRGEMFEELYLQKCGAPRTRAAVKRW